MGEEAPAQEASCVPFMTRTSQVDHRAHAVPCLTSNGSGSMGEHTGVVRATFADVRLTDATLQKALLDRVYDKRKAATLELEKWVGPRPRRQRTHSLTLAFAFCTPF